MRIWQFFVQPFHSFFYAHRFRFILQFLCFMQVFLYIAFYPRHLLFPINRKAFYAFFMLPFQHKWKYLYSLLRTQMRMHALDSSIQMHKFMLPLASFQLIVFQCIRPACHLALLHACRAHAKWCPTCVAIHFTFDQMVLDNRVNVSITTIHQMQKKPQQNQTVHAQLNVHQW